MERLDFQKEVLDCVVGGLSVIDIPRLKIKSIEHATDFIKTYGFDIENPDEVEKLWHFHRRAVVLITERLLKPGEQIPELLTDRKLLGDIRLLLLHASSEDEHDQEMQRWSCALLRVMHVFVHAENDLFLSFSEEIQKQILTPFEKCVITDGTGTYLTSPGSQEKVKLVQFDWKPFKASASTAIKLLAKSDLIGMAIFDKVGVRFITPTIFDSFKVIRFLVDHNLVSYPHIMPDQSSNTVYPADFFFEVMKEIESNPPDSAEQVSAYLNSKIDEKIKEARFVRKENTFSSSGYRFIKFICRRLIQIPSSTGTGSHSPGKPLTFFYPFEVQIVDAESHQKNQEGEAAHASYKERQREAARKRVLK